MNLQQTDFGLVATQTAAPEITEDTIYLVGVSGGKDSAAALIWLAFESGIPLNRIRATFFDNGNEHDWTIEHVKLLSDRVHFVEAIKSKISFYALALERHRFPSVKARFCTEVLKIWELQDYVQQLKKDGFDVIAISGVRADESEDRKKLSEWDYDGNLFCYKWRPLIRWTFADVVAFHAKHNVPMNPLYALGATRVGCWPCVMSNKKEIRTIALMFPERIDQIRTYEQRFEKEQGRYSPFFNPSGIPERFRTKNVVAKDGTKYLIATIDDVVRWSMSGKRAQGTYLDNPEDSKGCNSGYCE
jgi:3'-phosphoadenosine 5'-phosphosulfate sulfotransferase (PAPS reductase)/FAD synthetase